MIIKDHTWFENSGGLYFLREFLTQKSLHPQYAPEFLLIVRRTFLNLWCHGNHLLGIAGPGAPHTFAMDRRGDLGSLPDIVTVQCVDIQVRFFFCAPCPDSVASVLHPSRFAVCCYRLGLLGKPSTRST